MDEHAGIDLLWLRWEWRQDLHFNLALNLKFKIDSELLRFRLNLKKLSESANRYSINIKQVLMPILVFPLITSKPLGKLKESKHAYLIFPVYKPSLLFFKKT